MMKVQHATFATLAGLTLFGCAQAPNFHSTQEFDLTGSPDTVVIKSTNNSHNIDFYFDRPGEWNVRIHRKDGLDTNSDFHLENAFVVSVSDSDRTRPFQTGIANVQPGYSHYEITYHSSSGNFQKWDLNFKNNGPELTYDMKADNLSQAKGHWMQFCRFASADLMNATNQSAQPFIGGNLAFRGTLQKAEIDTAYISPDFYPYDFGRPAPVEFQVKLVNSRFDSLTEGNANSAQSDIHDFHGKLVSWTNGVAVIDARQD